METKKICQNCGREFNAKNKNAKFCSTSCRVSFYQKSQRKKAKKKSLIQKILMSLFIFFLALNLIFFLYPIALNSYKNYKIETNNRELKEFKQMNLHEDYFELKKANERNKEIIKIILNPENGWMTARDIKTCKKQLKIKIE